MRIKIIRTIFAMLLCTGQAWAFNTGNELHEALNSPADRLSAMRYIKGVSSGAAWGFELGKTGTVLTMSESEVQKGMKICYPATVTVGQITDVVAKYLTDNPAKRHIDASFIVLLALRTSFQC